MQLSAKKHQKPQKPRSAATRKRILKQIEQAWEEHPHWGIGRLISSAASISRAELRLNPHGVTDGEIVKGLRALIPESVEAGQGSVLAPSAP